MARSSILRAAAALLAAASVSATGRAQFRPPPALGDTSTLLPKWDPVWTLNRSTIFMPCNFSGFYDPVFAGTFGVADFDWSNAKQIYVNNPNGPMNCQELLLEQAAMVKAANPDTKVFIYRNGVKALNVRFANLNWI